MGIFRKWREAAVASEALEAPAAKKLNFDMTTKMILDVGYGDLSETSGRSVNSLMVDALIERILPANRDASVLMSRVYLAAAPGAHAAGIEPYGIQHALADVFRDELVLSTTRKDHDGRPFVELADDLFRQHRARTRCGDIADLALGSLASLENYMDAILRRTEDEFDALDLESEIRELRTLRGLYEEGRPQAASLFTNYVLRNWETLKANQNIYRLLAAVTEDAAPWKDTPANRARLSETCDAVYSSRDREAPCGE